MQILWSRTALARSSCRCSYCLHAATTLARRTTTAASRRRLKIGDVVTALYSTVLATAALADSKIKEDRTREWDRVIAEAREGKPLHELRPPGVGFKDNGRGAQPSPIANGSSSTTSHLNGLRDETTATAEFSHPYRPFQFKQKAENIERRDDDPVGTQPLPGVTVSKKGPPDLCDPNFAGIKPRHTHDLKQLETAVAGLVQQLLRKLSFYSDPDGTDAVTDDDTGREIHAVMGRFKSLSDHFTRLPIYSYDDVETVERQRSELLQSLKSIFNGADPTQQGKIDLMIVKLCYNLLISTAPPTTKTYDLLLTELSQLRRHDIVQDVVDAFWSSRLLPSKITLELIIRHYTATRDAEGLRLMRRKILGVDNRHGDGSKHWNQDSSERRVRFPNGSISRLPKDNRISDSLIRGHLEMQGVRPAIRLIRSAVRTGQKLEALTVAATIRLCLDKMDFGAGINLLMAILSPWTTGAASIPFFFDGHLRLMVHRLLHFLGVNPDLGSQGYLIRPLETDIAPREKGRQIQAPREALDEMLLHMRVEALTHRVNHMCKSIGILSDLFIYRDQLLVPDLAGDESFYEAMSYFDNQNKKHENKHKNGIINRGVRARSLCFKGQEAFLARLERTTECIALEIQLIESIITSEKKIGLLMERLESLDGKGASRKRIEYLKLLVWLFQHQMAAISLQVGWMDTDNVDSFETRLLHRSWKSQLLTDIEDRLWVISEMYSKFHATAYGNEVVPLKLEYLPSRPWMSSFTSRSHRNLDVFRTGLPMMDIEREDIVERVSDDSPSDSPLVSDDEDSIVILSIETA